MARTSHSEFLYDRLPTCPRLAKSLSVTQIDKLGLRLKSSAITREDLRQLDGFRRSFTPAYELVVGAIRNRLHLQPTGRPAKSTKSIIDKLRRETIRLSQVQDIAGCRLLVKDAVMQDEVAATLRNELPNAEIVDRRIVPSHGYRAVHVIAMHDHKLVEVQIRTEWQHLWAELSEKFADVIDPAIKYGGGNAQLQAFLIDLSEQLAVVENVSRDAILAQARLNSAMTRRGEVKEGMDQSAEELVYSDEGVRAGEARLRRSFDQMLSRISTIKDLNRVIPD